MSVFERHKLLSAYKKSEDMPVTPIPESIYQPSPIEQSPFFDHSAQAGGATPIPQLSFTNNPISSISSDGSANFATSVAPEASTALIPQDSVNRQIATASAQPDTKVLREPAFIRGTGKKSSGTLLAPKVTGKRTMTHAAVVILTVVVVLGTLGTVLPLNSNGHAAGISSLVNSFMNWTQAKNSNTALIASQIATATAVTQDGYDNGAATYAGVPAAPITSNGSASASDAGNLNRFFYGQCTYWANMRYHDRTGHWVPWLGNASAWPSQAAAYGWVVSSTPHVPSIIALAPYVQGAGYYGHVAVVESINGNDITTSNWNVGGAWATTTYVINHPGPGVLFLSFPGA